jgi:hypothetical protein
LIKGFNSRLDQLKKRTIELKDRSLEIINQEQKEKRTNKSEDGLKISETPTSGAMCGYTQKGKT